MRQAALEALENEHFVLGESVFKFEEEFARYIGTKYAVSLSSGTAALQAALRALGIGPGHTVVSPTFSFVATANAITITGALPRFVDSDPATANLTIDAGAADGCTALLPVHLYGTPCDWKAVKDAAEAANAPIVEDACQAHGAEYQGRKVGSLGDAGCFSFYSTKNVTVAGDGGMVTTGREDVRDFVASYRDCGRTGANRYDHGIVGDTLRLNTMNAAMGRAHLRAFPAETEERRRLARLYDRSLPEELRIHPTPNTDPVRHIYAIRHPKRDGIRAHLGERGIATGIHYPVPIHKQPAYASRNDEFFPVAESLAKEVLSIPFHAGLSDDEARRVIEAILEATS